MKVLVFTSSRYFLPLIFELVQKRSLAGVVIPSYNKEFITDITESGYIEEKDIFSHNLNESSALLAFLNLQKPDVCFVMAYPVLLQKQILEMPPSGFYNFHFGELPYYRGPDPIFWQIRNQEKEATVCVHKMDEHFDTGPVLFEEKIPLIPADTYASLYQKMVAYACMKLKFIIELIEKNDEPELKPQAKLKGPIFSKPKLNDVCIDWENMDVNEIMATVNAGNPWNKGAITRLEENEYRILQISPANIDHELPDEPGLIYYADEKQGVFVICKNKQLIRVDSIYTSQGFISMGRIIGLGLTKGKKFET